jgi:hypothetical protein
MDLVLGRRGGSDLASDFTGQYSSGAPTRGRSQPVVPRQGAQQKNLTQSRKDAKKRG